MRTAGRKLLMASVKEIHQKQLEMALVVKDICDRHKIDYFLDAGTLLGAAKYKGFIPWDDDIDIGFLRKNYEKFVSVAKEELPDNIFFQEWKSEKKFGYPYAKLRMENTKYRLETDGNSKANDGIFLDLLPYDCVPDNLWLRKYHKKRLRILYLIIQYKLDYKPKAGSVEKFVASFLKIFWNTDEAKSRYTSLCQRYNDSDNTLVTEADGIDYDRFTIPKDYLIDKEELLFENYLFTCPKQYEEYLTSVYGDYHKDPPKSAQEGKHGVLVAEILC